MHGEAEDGRDRAEWQRAAAPATLFALLALGVILISH
jgi:hypothetical protein